MPALGFTTTTVTTGTAVIATGGRSSTVCRPTGPRGNTGRAELSSLSQSWFTVVLGSYNPNEAKQPVRSASLQEVAPTWADSLEPRARTANSSRTPDLSLKLGRKTAAAEDEASRDLPRFTDTTYETHVQNNARKTLGVEFLVPFH
jgi:hypothetical protein